MQTAESSRAPGALDSLVRRLRLHSPLSEADAKALCSLPFQSVKARANSHLVREGDPTSSCAVLLSGFVHRFRLGAFGQRQILAVYVRGDPLDFDHLYLEVADDGLQAITDVHLAYVPHRQLLELMRSRPGVDAAINRALQVDASIFREWTLNVGRRDAIGRIAHLLCEISLRLQAQGVDVAELPLPLTQDQIADATGLTTVHVNRTLRAMHSEGMLKRRGAQVMLPRLDDLREVAGFDARYLHQEQAPAA